MSPAYHRIPEMLKGFQQMKNRPPKYRCTLQCTLDHKFIMDRNGMESHAQEEEHQRRVMEKEAIEWAEWNIGAERWNEMTGLRWTDPEQVMAAQKQVQWEGSEEERQRQEAEREKREWILNWVAAVHAAIHGEDIQRALAIV